MASKSFTPLSERIEQLPIIICGPIVRRADDKGVTVWLALRKAAKLVTLSVFEDEQGSPGKLVVEGKEPTISFGMHLHIIAVTASGDLKWGESYLYNIKIEIREKSYEGLNDEELLGKNGNEEPIKKITYHDYQLPSFVLLPKEDVSKIHLLHGSCRLVHSEGLDAMQSISEILKNNWDRQKRPQQLYLTGDQIYADHVDDAMLYMLTDAAHTLVNGGDINKEEILPEIEKTIKDRSLLPGRRHQPVVNIARFTTTGAGSHLLSLGEYFAMYLFVWSDLFWPEGIKKGDELQRENYPYPTPLEVYFGVSERSLKGESKKKWESIKQKLPDKEEEFEKLDEESKEKTQKELEKFEEEFAKSSQKEGLSPVLEKDLVLKMSAFDWAKRIDNLIYFQQNIAGIRRALANISTFMIFDDHEVTDDWHLNYDWFEEAYKHALARRVMMNGLAAYACFQAWGNKTEDFKENSIAYFGYNLLNACKSWIASAYKSQIEERAIALYTNIPVTDEEAAKAIKAAKAGNIPPLLNVIPELKTQIKEGLSGTISGSEVLVKWHFTFQHPKFEVIFTDARTQRSFPGTRYKASEHISETAIVKQVPLTDYQPEFTLLISPCNLVTVPYFRSWAAKYGLPIFSAGKDVIKRVKSAINRKHLKAEGWDPFTEGGLDRSHMPANDPDLADSWVPQSRAFEHIVARLSMRTPPKNGKRQSRIIVFSGDVHFSAVMRMQYWGLQPYEVFADDPIQSQIPGLPKSSPSEFVMAHLVASGFKNQTGIWQPLNYVGYELDDFLDRKEKLPVPEQIIGYAKKDKLIEEKANAILRGIRWFPNYRPSMIRREPVLIPFHEQDHEITYPRPDWMYRIDAIRGERMDTKKTQKSEAGLLRSRGGGETLDKIIEGGKKALKVIGEAVETAVNWHIDQGKAKFPATEIIGKNSMAEITFQWQGEGKLNKDVKEEDTSFTAEITRKFPTPPFQAFIGEEIIEVHKLDNHSQPLGKFSQIRRGINNTKKSSYEKGTVIKIRKTVSQVQWVAFHPEEADRVLNPELKPGKEALKQEGKLYKQAAKPLTRFMVPMEYEDTKYKKPNIPLDEPE